MKKIAVVLAGGRGSRMNSDIPKQYLMLKDRPVLYYALKAFQDSDIDSIVLAAGENDLEMIQYAGLGVAMGNAVPLLKQAADLVAPACDEDGAARMLEQLI